LSPALSVNLSPALAAPPNRSLRTPPGLSRAVRVPPSHQGSRNGIVTRPTPARRQILSTIDRIKGRAGYRDDTQTDELPSAVHTGGGAVDLGSIAALRGGYLSGALRPVVMVAEVLARIEAAGEDHVWIAVLPPEELFARAAELERIGSRPDLVATYPLFGVPFAVTQSKWQQQSSDDKTRDNLSLRSN